MQPLRHTENQPEYGGLVIQPLRVRHDFQRKIPEDDWLQCHAEHEVIFKEMEKHDLKSREKYDPFDDLDFPRECVRPQWTYALRQSCNNFHDLTYDFTSTLWSSTDRFYRAQYLGSGLFRDAFLFTPTDTHNTPFVIKNKVYERELDQSDMHKINTEALVMEILSAPTLTTNIYGHCGSSILVEPGREIEDQIIPGTPHPGGNLGRISQAELDKLQQGDVHPMNNLTVEQKLDIAIAMAESLAELHGFKDGVMTNDDIDLGQWMYAADGRVILNDFNNAMLMEWGNKVKRYCQYWRKFNGFFKSPEEYDGSFLDER